MKKELMEALKAALKIKGLNEELYEFITISEPSEAEEAVNKLVGKLPTPANLDVAATLARPEFKSEMDKAITKAIETNTANLKKKWNIKDEPNPNEPNPDDPKLDPNVKALMEMVTGLKSELETLKTGKTIDEKKAEAAKKLAASTVLNEKYKEKWAARIDVNSATPVEDQIKGLEEEYNDLLQVIANDGNYSRKPGTGGSDTTATEAEAAEIVGNVL